MPTNPYYNNNPMFPNPYDRGYSQPSAPSAGSGGGGWLNTALSAAPMALGAVNPLLGIGTSLVTGLLGGLFGGDGGQKKQAEHEKEMLRMKQAERAKYRDQSRRAFQGQQQQYQQMAANLFPEMSPQDFIYSNPTVDNAITNALMYRMGNFFSDWGVPQNRRRGGEQLQNQFFAGMGLNPFDVSGGSGNTGGWYENFSGRKRGGGKGKRRKK